MDYHNTVDLHTHSTASDGDISPAGVVDIASDAGIKILSLTDHDTVDGLEAARERARELGINFIPGMEISARSDEELHILGYYIEESEPQFRDGLELLLSYRMKRETITIEYLKSKGVYITAEEVRQASGGNIIGRPHMAAVMIDKGYVKTKKEAFDKYIGTSEYMSLDRPKTTAQESIDIIRRGRGVPVLAHPHTLKQNYRKLDRTLRDLKEMGLKGMECYYNSYSREEVVNYLSLAAKHGLVPTGGSDFHGPKTKPDVIMGSGKKNMLDFNDLDIADTLFKLKV